MSYDEILSTVATYYTRKLAEHGATSKGVDWNSPESQQVRFQQLMRVADQESEISINDWGCGYAALVDYVVAQGRSFTYCGFDVSAAMVQEARRIYGALHNCRFVERDVDLPEADYTVASGIFNVRQGISDERWLKYMEHTVGQMHTKSVRGFAFNALTSYSDLDKRRGDLYYADPAHWFDFCMCRYSHRVALLHDYQLWEFTILVRK